MFEQEKRERELIVNHLKSDAMIYESMAYDELKLVIRNARDHRKTQESYFKLIQIVDFLFVLTSSIVHSFNPIIRSPQLFEVNESRRMGELDFIIKLWGHLVELAFTKTALRRYYI
ncbi:unnamed protein product [Rhizopus stolonifer]